jgi:hypothetical protein
MQSRKEWNRGQEAIPVRSASFANSKPLRGYYAISNNANETIFVFQILAIYIVTCYATEYAVRIGNPFIVILNHT